LNAICKGSVNSIPNKFLFLAIITKCCREGETFSQVQRELDQQKEGWLPDLSSAVNLTIKILAHIILDLIVITVVIVGFHLLQQLLVILGDGNNSFITTLISYSESATLLVYISFSVISIIGILKEEWLFKLIETWLSRRRGLE